MSEEKDFQQRVRRIGALVEEIESIADPAVRASTRQLVQLVMEFHGTAPRPGAGNPRQWRRAGHGVHRATGPRSDGQQPARCCTDCIRRAWRLASAKRWSGWSPSCGAMARRLSCWASKAERCAYESRRARHTCGSTTKALQATVEDAIYEAAPDIASLTVEGLDGQPANGFVSLDKLTGQAPVASNMNTPAVPSAVANYGD